MNVVTSETLKDTMAHPEHYRNLIVRIANYSAYFVTRNRDMQLEFIERAECHACHRLIANGVQGDFADAAAARHCGSVILELAKKIVAWSPKGSTREGALFAFLFSVVRL